MGFTVIVARFFHGNWNDPPECGHEVALFVLSSRLCSICWDEDAALPISACHLFLAGLLVHRQTAPSTLRKVGTSHIYPCGRGVVPAYKNQFVVHQKSRTNTFAVADQTSWECDGIPPFRLSTYRSGRLYFCLEDLIPNVAWQQAETYSYTTAAALNSVAGGEVDAKP